jgi:3-deoxy-D-manno-octulosonate 8-phosphate phosphatase (KDO 8-P phosphatase)
VGLELAFLSGGRGEAIKQRARHLGIKHCFTAIRDKAGVLAELQERLQISIAATAFIGDDVNDLPVRPSVGVLVTPANGCIALKRKADLVLNQRGGDGAVRELVEQILRAKAN